MIVVNNTVRMQLTITALAVVSGYAKPCLDEVNQSPAPKSDGGADQQRISALAGLDSAPVVGQRLSPQARARAKAARLGWNGRLEPEQRRPGAGVWVEPGAGEAIPGDFRQAKGGKPGEAKDRRSRLSAECQKYLLHSVSRWSKHLPMMFSTITESPVVGGGAQPPSRPSTTGDFEFRRKPEADGSHLSSPACRARNTAGAFFVRGSGFAFGPSGVEGMGAQLPHRAPNQPLSLL